ENIMNYLDKLGNKMVHMHIVDSDGVSESHVCPGLGVLPLKELMAELKDYGYDGNITIELVTNYLNEPSIYSKMAINNLKEYL
ncbi:TIM barrel protein, partial [Anaerococcus vaginalis]|uniref:TIM barrel protein n=2 Tax=Anaerococcus TaxID=165779 RepID=UPI002903B188